MYHIVNNFKNVLFCLHCVFLCFVQYNSDSPTHSNLLVFTKEINFLLRSTKTGLLYIVNTNFRLQGSCHDSGGLLSVSPRGCSCLFLD